MPSPSMSFWPLSWSGLDRFKRTMPPIPAASPTRIARALLAGVLSILLMFNFLRAGMQIIGGLDPNFTVNAWGGPGYVGALLAHYLDAAYLFYVEALLLNLALDEGTQCPKRARAQVERERLAQASANRGSQTAVFWRRSGR